MGNSIEKTKGWLGVVLIVWPIIRVIAAAAGFPLPDLGGAGELFAVGSQGAGTYLLAKSEKLGKKK